MNGLQVGIINVKMTTSSTTAVAAKTTATATATETMATASGTETGYAAASITTMRSPEASSLSGKTDPKQCIATHATRPPQTSPLSIKTVYMLSSWERVRANTAIDEPLIDAHYQHPGN